MPDLHSDVGAEGRTAARTTKRPVAVHSQSNVPARSLSCAGSAANIQPGPDGPQTAAELRSIGLLKGLPDEALAEIFGALKPRRLRARSTQVIDSEASQIVGFAWTGRYRITAVSPSGSSVTL